MRWARSAREGEPARPGDLKDAEGLQEPEERGDLLLVARQLDDEGVLGQVRDPCAEDLLDLEDLRSRLGVRADLNEDELARDRQSLLEIHDLHDVDELAKLLRAK